MSWVFSEEMISALCAYLNFLGKCGKRRSERVRCARLDQRVSSSGLVLPSWCSRVAASASALSFGRVAANFCFHAASSSRVSRICEAIASCSSRERAATLRNASSSKPVTSKSVAEHLGLCKEVCLRSRLTQRLRLIWSRKSRSRRISRQSNSLCPAYYQRFGTHENLIQEEHPCSQTDSVLYSRCWR